MRKKSPESGESRLKESSNNSSSKRGETSTNLPQTKNASTKSDVNCQFETARFTQNLHSSQNFTLEMDAFKSEPMLKMGQPDKHNHYFNLKQIHYSIYSILFCWYFLMTFLYAYIYISILYIWASIPRHPPPPPTPWLWVCIVAP